MLRLSLKMTGRDWRAGQLRFLLVALIVAVAALSAVGFFVDRLRAGLNRDAHQLLGADLVISADQPVNAVWRAEARQARFYPGRYGDLPQHGAGGRGRAIAVAAGVHQGSLARLPAAGQAENHDQTERGAGCRGPANQPGAGTGHPVGRCGDPGQPECQAGRHPDTGRQGIYGDATDRQRTGPRRLLPQFRPPGDAALERPGRHGAGAERLARIVPLAAVGATRQGGRACAISSLAGKPDQDAGHQGRAHRIAGIGQPADAIDPGPGRPFSVAGRLAVGHAGRRRRGDGGTPLHAASPGCLRHAALPGADAKPGHGHVRDRIPARRPGRQPDRRCRRFRWPSGAAGTAGQTGAERLAARVHAARIAGRGHRHAVAAGLCPAADFATAQCSP